MATEFKLGELAERFSLGIRGDAATMICGVASLSSARPGQLAFLANPKLRPQLATAHASAIVLSPDVAADYTGNALLARNPHAAFARIAGLFDDRPAIAAGVHASAVVEDGASIDAHASVGPFCHIAAGARIEAGAVLGPHCIVGPDCVVGAQSLLVARVTLVTRVTLGKRVTVHPGAVIGADGFGLAFDEGAWLKVPQLGGVRIGDDCEIGANTTIDRGALEDTVLEEDVRLDNLIQIGHNVRIGAHSALAGCVGVAGSARIGRYCLVGGAAGINGHIDICDRVTITAMSLVSHSIREPGEYSSGIPVQESRQWRRNAARIRQLDRFFAGRTDKNDKDENK
jgi:UDP-3-O-[3-hydroxymyristoyl] glucosamine N-acyltransferase